MEASYTMTEEEYVKANKLFTKLSRKTVIIYLAAATLLATIAIIADSLALRLVTLGALIGGFVGDIIVRKVYAPIKTRKQYLVYKAAQEPIRVESQDYGLHFSAAIGDAKIEWDRIFKWRESPDLLLIYQAPEVYHVIPKRIGTLANEISKSLSENVGPAS